MSGDRELLSFICSDQSSKEKIYNITLFWLQAFRILYSDILHKNLTLVFSGKSTVLNTNKEVLGMHFWT